MKRTQRTLLTSSLVLLAGGALAVAAWHENRLEPERIRQEAEKKRLFRFGVNDVVRGELFAKGARISFERVGQDAWRLTAPVAWPGDRETITAALSQMSAISADTLVIEPATAKDLADYGLDHPTVSLTVRLENGAEHALLVGAKNEVESSYYVTTEERRAVWLAPDAFYWALDREVFAFRKKQLLDLDRAAISQIKVLKQGAPLFMLEKQGETWKLGRDTLDLVADPMIIGRFLLILTRDLKAEALVTDEADPADAPGLEPFGLAQPAFVVEVTGEADRVVRLRVGTGPESEPSEERPAYVLLDGTRSIAQVYAAFPKDLDRSLEDLRDRTLANFAPEKVERVELLLMNGKKAVLERGRTEGSWRITSPFEKAAKSWKADALLTRFAKLRSNRIHREEATQAELREWLVEPPEQRATFFDAQGIPLADIRIGKYFDQVSVFVSPAGWTRVDLVNGAQLDVVPKFLEDLVDPEG